MITPDDIILAHAKVPYDPVKRRERYLRTRKLKGRKPGQGPTTGTRRVGGTSPSHVSRPSSPTSRRKAASSKGAAHRKEVHAKVIALSNKLHKLRKELEKLVELAKRRSGVEPTGKPKASATTKKAEPAGSKKQTSTKTQTAAQKKESAERSKEYYDEHKKSSGSKNTQTERLENQIAQTSQKIMRARKYLKAVAANARKDVDSNRPAAKRRQTS